MNFELLHLNINVPSIITPKSYDKEEMIKHNRIFQIKDSPYVLWNDDYKGNRQFINLISENNHTAVKMNKTQIKAIFNYFSKRKQIINVESKIDSETSENIFKNLYSFFYKVRSKDKITSFEIKAAMFEFSIFLDNCITNEQLDTLVITIRIPTYSGEIDFKLFNNLYSYYSTQWSLPYHRYDEASVQNAAFSLYFKILQINKWIPINRMEPRSIFQKVKISSLFR